MGPGSLNWPVWARKRHTCSPRTCMHALQVVLLPNFGIEAELPMHEGPRPLYLPNPDAFLTG